MAFFDPTKIREILSGQGNDGNIAGLNFGGGENNLAGTISNTAQAGRETVADSLLRALGAGKDSLNDLLMRQLGLAEQGFQARGPLRQFGLGALQGLQQNPLGIFQNSVSPGSLQAPTPYQLPVPQDPVQQAQGGQWPQFPGPPTGTRFGPPTDRPPTLDPATLIEIIKGGRR